MRKKTRQSVAYTIFSHIYEHYENSLFSFVAPFLAAAFFSHEDGARTGMFYALATSVFMRPVGAIIFSWVGDKYGRRKALTYCIGLYAFSAVLIAFLPSYASVGPWASFGLIVVRVFQGISVGGGFYATLTLISEADSVSKRNVLLGFSLSMGFFGALIGTMCAKFSMEPDLPYYAWRIPFIIGAIYGVLLFYFRRAIQESTAWEKAEHSHFLVPFLEAFKDHSRNIVAVLLFGMAMLSPFYVITAWLPSKLGDIFQLHASDSLVTTARLMVVCGVCIVFFSWLVTWIKPKIMLIFGCFFCLFCFFAFSYALEKLDYSLIVMSQYLITISTAIFSAPTFLLIQKLFPIRYKFSGFAVPFAVGQAVFLGPTPLMCEKIVETTGRVADSAYLLLVSIALIALATYLAKPQKSILN
jgi:MHS family proline/betaine transporter-like MFS transporter